MTPTPNGENGHELALAGRDPQSGRFLRGNAGGPGNPRARQVAEYREAMLAAVSEDDVYDVIRAVVEKAKRGDMMAASLLFDRLLGKAKATLAVEAGPAKTDEDLVRELATIQLRFPRLAGLFQPSAGSEAAGSDTPVNKQSPA